MKNVFKVVKMETDTEAEDGKQRFWTSRDKEKFIEAVLLYGLDYESIARDLCKGVRDVELYSKGFARIFMPNCDELIRRAKGSRKITKKKIKLKKSTKQVDVKCYE
jgi:hypothetical protein